MNPLYAYDIQSVIIIYYRCRPSLFSRRLLALVLSCFFMILAAPIIADMTEETQISDKRHPVETNFLC